MKDKATNQSRQTVHASQVNADGDVNIEHFGDSINTGGGDYIARDKIRGDVVVTGFVSGDVIVNYAARPEIPSPPPPQHPPEVDLFVGRDKVLAYYKNCLHQFGLAIISGMAGVGKTALAAVLARNLVRPENIFWHTFHKGEGVESIIWRLAGFLETHGQESLWHMLQTTSQTGGQLPPPDLLLDFLIQQLREQRYILCFDDFHHVDEDPHLQQLVERIQPLLTEETLRIIVTTRKSPNFAKELNFAALKGLDDHDVRHLLAASNVIVEDALALRLHHTTGGNPELLTLAIDLLQGTPNAADLIQNLVIKNDIEDFLMDQIEKNLSRKERAVMGAIAVLQGYPGSQATISAILDGRRVRRTLRDLSDRFLLTVTRTANRRLYSQHAIVEAFFYKGLNKKKRRRIHRRAGEHYQNIESDHLLAARHFFLSGNFITAADLVTTNVLILINKGETRQLNRLLARFNTTHLDIVRWLQVQLALGQTHAYFGENPAARAVYEHALMLVEDDTSGEGIKLYPHICLVLGDLLKQESPPEALKWYERGVAAQPADDQNLRAALLIGRGTVYMYLNEFVEAQSRLQEGFESLPAEPSQLHVTALENLAVVAANFEGDHAKGIELAQQALALSMQLNDRFKSTEIIDTIGTFHHMANDWATATQYFEQALEAAQELGNERMMAKVFSNLGGNLMLRGDYNQAQSMLQQGLSAAHNTHQQHGVCLLLNNLALLNLLTKQWQAARQQLAKVESLAAELSMEFLEIDISRMRAELALAEGIESPLPFALRALEVAQRLGDPMDEGASLKVLAQVLATIGKREKSNETFAKSLALLEPIDRYGAALCQVAWGSNLLSYNPERAASLLENAREIFFQLGANAEYRKVKQLLL